MRATNQGKVVWVDVSKQEFVTLLRPNGMLQICASSCATARGLMRPLGGIIEISFDQIAVIMATDPRHELDRELKKLLALQRVAIA